MLDKLRMNPTPLIFRGFFALLFSWLFIYAPWSQMALESNDVPRYLLRIDLLLNESDTNVDDLSLSEFIKSEPLWRYILIYIGDLFDKPIDGLQLVSFCTIFIYAFFLYGRINLFLASLFLFNPMVIDLVISQIRSAFAMALFLVALMIQNRLIRLIVIAIASLIHTITFVLFLVYIFSKLLELNRNRFTYKLLGIAALFFGLVLAIILAGGKEMLAGATGDRRFGPGEVQVSFIYLSFWMLLAIALALPFIQRYDETLREYWTNYYAIVMLALPFLMGIFGVNSVRFAALCFPILLYSMSTYTVPVRALFLASLFAYQIVQYYFWLQTF